MNKEKDEIKIRRCSRKEAPQIIRLVQEVWQQVPDKSWFAVDEEGYLDAVCHDEHTLLWGAFYGERLAAVLIVVLPVADRYLDVWMPDPNLPVAYMDIVAVSPDFRGYRLQQRLMREAEPELREQGIAYLQCTVHPDNIYSRNNIRAIGYEELAEVPLYGGCPRVVLGKRL